MLVADLPPVPAQETPIVWVQTVPRFGEDGARLDGVRNEATCGAMPVGYCALRGLQVEGNGFKVQIRYYIAVTDDMGETKNTNPVCKETNGGHWWKISLNPAPDYTSDIQPLLTFTGISPRRAQ